MTFFADFQSWTLPEFIVHLGRHNPAVGAWAGGIVYHHTAVPGASWAHSSHPAIWDAGEAGLRVAQIRAKRLGQVRNTAAYYRDQLGWDRGPHLFADDRFIYQMTPLDTPGIHAIGANDDRIGLEVVGDFTHVGWPPAVAANALGAGAAWLRWQTQGVNDTTVRGHRDYNKPSCPGDAIDLDAVRLALAAINSPIRSAAPNPAPAATPNPQQLITPDSLLLAPARADVATLVRAVLARPHGAYTDADCTVILGWYVGSCAEVGLDPLLVVAQLVHETDNLSSFWAARPQRNPAGLGVTGEAGKGLSFPSWKESIVAHTGRLLAYALPPGTATATQQARITAALRSRALPADLLGSAQTPRALTGRWATDPAYGLKLAATAERLRAA